MIFFVVTEKNSLDFNGSDRFFYHPTPDKLLVWYNNKNTKNNWEYRTETLSKWPEEKGGSAGRGLSIYIHMSSCAIVLPKYLFPFLSMFLAI